MTGVLTDAMDTSAVSPDDDTSAAPKSELRRLTKDEAGDLDEARQSGRTDKVMADAERRDEEATIRDAVSDERARVADREAFTDVNGVYKGHAERRAAALDRANSKVDREFSAEDRAYLSNDTSAEEQHEPSVSSDDEP